MPFPIQLLAPNENIPVTAKPITLEIKDLKQLYMLYIPAFKFGGLFLNKQSFTVGSKVFILLQLPGSQAKKPVSGKVAWVTQQNAQVGFFQGVGIAFDESEGNKQIKNEIEALIAPLLNKAEFRSCTL